MILVVLRLLGLSGLCLCWCKLALAAPSSSTNSCIDSWNRKFDDSKSWPTIQKLLTQLSKNKKISTTDGQYLFSFCDDPTEGQRPNVKGGIWSKTDHSLIGTSNGSDLRYQSTEPWIALYTKKADACTLKYNSGSVTISSNHSSIVIFACDLNSDTPKFSSLAQFGDICSHLFVFSSKLLCNLTQLLTPIVSTSSGFTTATVVLTSPTLSTVIGNPALKINGSISTTLHAKSNGISWTLFFFILCLFALSYILVGFLYKRYVDGARGIEQIPHYLFWLRLMNSVRAFFSSSTTRSNGYDPSSRYRNDFQYDQPPLLDEDPSPMILDADDDSTGSAETGPHHRIRGFTQTTVPQVRVGNAKVEISRHRMPQDGGPGSDTDERLLIV